MSRKLATLVSLAAIAATPSVLALSSCTVQPADADSRDLVGATEAASHDAGAVIETLHVGDVLFATTDVNLRTGPSTTSTVLRVVPSGSRVTVALATSKEAFIKIKHHGTVGWSFGAYYTSAIPTTTSGGGSGGSGGSAGQGAERGISHGYGGIGGSTGSAPTASAGGSGGSGGTTNGSGSAINNSDARTAAMARAEAGVGFSYWWGHGRLLPDGPTTATAGSCAGNCPSCTHGGSYGADCSGYVGKVWQVPGSNADLAVDSHPYNTKAFVADSALWTTVPRSSLLVADALVYNTNGEGHVFLYSSGDGWGSIDAYECKGCSYGCVHGLRSASSAYHGIRRAGY